MLFYILEAQVEQTETCRRAGSENHREVPCEHAEDPGGFRFCKWQRILNWPARQICQKNTCQKFLKNNVVYASPTDIWIDFTSMISHVKSYALKYMISGNFFLQGNLQPITGENKAATLGRFSFFGLP